MNNRVGGFFGLVISGILVVVGGNEIVCGLGEVFSFQKTDGTVTSFIPPDRNAAEDLAAGQNPVYVFRGRAAVPGTISAAAGRFDAACALCGFWTRRKGRRADQCVLVAFRSLPEHAGAPRRAHGVHISDLHDAVCRFLRNPGDRQARIAASEERRRRSDDGGRIGLLSRVFHRFGGWRLRAGRSVVVSRLAQALRRSAP